MAIDLKNSVYRACRMLLRPVASIALRCGMTWKEFSDLSKSVFVDVATREFGIRGRPTNISRVSILTGISRKEVKRQRDLLREDPDIESRKTTDATRVLSGWYQDAEFCDADGKPLDLPEEGPSPSFSSLLDRYSGDVPPRALLKELMNGQAVERTADGKLRAISRYYMPVPLEPESILRAGSVIRDLGDNIRYNLYRKKGSPSRFEGRATNDHLTPEQAALFREFIQERGQSFLEEIDEWLTRHEPGDKPAGTQDVRLGIGLFAIEENIPQEKTS